jgi:D-3-phosphoglycerate dehydrogenase
MATYQVVVSDQVFPTVDLEREMLAEIDAELEVAKGDIGEVLEVARDADAILNTYLPWSEESIARLEKCKIIARYGIGIDNVDVEAASRHGVIVTNVPDYSVQEVAAHASALMLAHLRKILVADEVVRSGAWSIDNMRPIRRISELTLGLVGFGRIARQLAATAESLGMDLLVHDPFIQPGEGIPPLVGVDELLERSDVVSLHAPLTPETKGMIGARELGLMGEGSLLVNTSRGPLVVLDDLLDALRSGVIGGAVLDVFDDEPLDATRIEGVPNLIVTPHMAYYSEAALQESQRKATTQVIKVLSGEEPDYRVSP